MRPILVCVDFSDVTPRVMDEAKELALALRTEAHLLHVVPMQADYVMYSPGAALPTVAVAPDLRVETEKMLKLKTQLVEAGISASFEMLEGVVVEEILAAAERTNAQRIVMGSHGHGALYHLVLGSVSEAVLRKSKVPLVIVPSRG